MKKQFLSIALVLCMVLSLMPMAVFADDTVLVGEGTADDPWILTKAVLEKYYLRKGTVYYLSAGNYKLGENISLDGKSPLCFEDIDDKDKSQGTFTGFAKLDLNGKTLSREGDVNLSLIRLEEGGTLTIDDSSEEETGRIELDNQSADKNSAITLKSGAKLILNGGTISAKYYSAIKYEGNVTIELNGSTVTIEETPMAFATKDLQSNSLTLYANGGTINGDTHCGEEGKITKDPDAVGTVVYGDLSAGGNRVCVVTFKSEENSIYVNEFIPSGDKVTAPADPTKDDFKFYGWYNEAACTTEYKFDENTGKSEEEVTYNTTLMPKWICAGEHTGGTATCIDKAICTACGEEYGEVDSTKHTGIKEWSTKNETQHEQTWKCCGAVEVALENHEWKDGVCEECGYICLHTGGTADCIHKAKCEVCGDEYGEINTDNHTTLKHIDAKAATTEAEGNIEYWHCEECGKYFSDKDGKNEIKLADTVIAKLTKTDSEEKSPQTGDNSHMALWFALLFVSGGTFAGITVYSKKKKHFVK